MPDWDGRGLPPAATARIARGAAPGAVRSSLLSVGGLAGIESVGFEIAGEVMGCRVSHLGFRGFGGCGYGGGWNGAINGAYGARTVTSSTASSWSGYGPYVRALQEGWGSAVERLLTECRALGADGAVDVRLTQEHLGNGNREFVALGTAVRSRGSVHPSAPFCTQLPGQDVAKLLQAGWIPTGIAIGISVAVRHDDWATARQVSSWSGNTEITGYTELVTHVRADARHQFGVRAAQAGGDGAIVTDMKLHVWKHEAGEGHTDHVAEATVTGGAVARIPAGARGRTRTSSLSILPLRPSQENRR